MDFAAGVYLSEAQNPNPPPLITPCIRVYRDCIQRKTWCMGPYAGFDFDSPYLIVIGSSFVSYPPPLQSEKGRVGKISSIGRAHLYLSANFQNNK
jgi:hypothetical protein